MPCRGFAAAALKDEVLAMEHGPDTVIGSGGTRLSGGQAQRLALARTLAHPAPGAGAGRPLLGTGPQH